jgi:hypothetical protein
VSQRGCHVRHAWGIGFSGFRGLGFRVSGFKVWVFWKGSKVFKGIGVGLFGFTGFDQGPEVNIFIFKGFRDVGVLYGIEGFTDLGFFTFVLGC